MNSSLEQARADLQATLTGKKAATQQPQSEAEAREQLKQTQQFLAQQSQPSAKRAKPK